MFVLSNCLPEFTHLRRGLCVIVFSCAALVVMGASREPILVRGNLAHPSRIVARLASVAGRPAQLQALGPTRLQIVRESRLVSGLVVFDEETPLVAAMSVAQATPLPTSNDPAETLLQRCAELMATGLYLYAEPDYQVELHATPTDAHLADGTLWGLRNTGANGGASGVDIDADSAWAITQGSAEVIVAVVDSGIHSSHVELIDRMWRNTAEIPGNGIDDDSNGMVDDVFGPFFTVYEDNRHPRDVVLHGTHIAGTIAASADNGRPLIGVAPGVRLMACKFIGDDFYDQNVSNAIACIEYAVARGARVVNASWGVPHSFALRDAISAANDAGVLFVVSAGNGDEEGHGIDHDVHAQFPSDYDEENIVSCAALERTGIIAPFSDYGANSVEIGAPGVGIVSCGVTDPDRLGKSAIVPMSGTSMAAPHVAGVAALALSRFPDLSAAELRSLLITSARPLPGVAGKTISGGIVDAYRALTAFPDGQLEVVLQTRRSIVSSGSILPLRIRVTDLRDVENATVTATTSTGQLVEFRNDGVAPDRAAGDGEYSAVISAPNDAGTLSLDIEAKAPGKRGARTTARFHVVQAPANDTFDNRIVLPGESATVSGTNVGAWHEPDEPAHVTLYSNALQGEGASVWWSWTAPQDCSVTVRILKSDVHVVLNVYTGESLAALERVAPDPEEMPGIGRDLEVVFQATAGTAYAICVDGHEREAGQFLLTVQTSESPANDAFAHRLALSGSDVSVVAAAISATHDPGDPFVLSSDGDRSVWYTWKAPRDGAANVKFRWPELGMPRFLVLQGDMLGELSLVPGTSRYGQDETTFRVAEGEEYVIKVCSTHPKDPPMELSIRCAERPANDDFGGRTQLNGASVEVRSSNDFATPGMIGDLGDGRGSLWWSWTAPADGTGLVEASVDGGYGHVRVFQGTNPAALTPVYTKNPSTSDDPSVNRIWFAAIAGQTYQILITGGEDRRGDVALTVRLVPTPQNDSFSRRTIIRQRQYHEIVDSAAGSVEPSEPEHSIDSSRPARWSRWWTYTAPERGVVALEARSPIAKCDINVYKGDSLGSLKKQHTANDNWHSSHVAHVAFPVDAGTTYQLALYGTIGSPTGAVDFSLRFDPAPKNDGILSATPLSGTDVTVAGSMRGAWRDSSMSSLFAPVWWSWTAPGNGILSVDTSGSEFDPRPVVVYESSTSPGEFEGVSGVGFIYSTLWEIPAFPVQAGQKYFVAFVGAPGASSSVYNSVIGDIRARISWVAQPPNDNYASAAVIPGAGVVVEGTSVGASREADEQYLGAGYTSVWWKWTAERDGIACVDTTGSAASSLIKVYDEPPDFASNGLNEVAHAGTSAGGGPNHRLFAARAGRTYHIALLSTDGYGGPVTLSVSLSDPPGNDKFSAPTELSGGDVDVAGTNWGATRDEGELDHALAPSGASVWWLWTAPADCDVSLSTLGSSFDTTLAVYRGSDVSNLELVAWVDDTGGSHSGWLTFHATEGEAYRIAVDGFNGAVGSVRLRLVGGERPDAAIVCDPVQPWEGAAFTLHAVALGTGPLQYQWFHDNVEIEGATTLTHSIPSAQGYHQGVYAVVVSNVFGSRRSEPYEVLVERRRSSGARLTNLSTRALDLTGNNVLIPGFVIRGTGTKRMLIRGVGPGLFSTFELEGTLADPVLSLGSEGRLVDSNDDWGASANKDAIIATSKTVGAFPLVEGSKDSVLLVDLPPGTYTAPTAGAEGGTGIAMVELYDADPGPSTAHLVNISNRGFVDIGHKIMIPGFVISREGSRTVLIRAVGPGLEHTFKLEGVLEDPVLTVFHEGEPILSNDDWSSNRASATTESTSRTVGAFPLQAGSKDAAFVVTLPPGVYTAQATGKNDTTGIVLVEVYLVP